MNKDVADKLAAAETPEERKAFLLNAIKREIDSFLDGSSYNSGKDLAKLLRVIETYVDSLKS